jgi:hypothetical protein
VYSTTHEPLRLPGADGAWWEPRLDRGRDFAAPCAVPLPSTAAAAAATVAAAAELIAPAVSVSETSSG